MKKLILPFLLLISLITFGQDKPDFKIYGGLQFWMRYTELNPGSSIGNGQYEESFDISIRRYRLGIKGSLFPAISYNLQLGNNNLSRYQKDQPPKILDAYVTYKFHDKLNVTGGKHAWTGLSRFAAPSTFSALGADINFSANPTLNAHDDFFRKLGVAFHGNLKQLSYRLVFSKPFLYEKQAPLSTRAVLTDNPTSLNISGYFNFQFFDQEIFSSAFSPWTYLGEKKLLNVGAGWTYQKSASESIISSNDTISHPMLSFAVDVFLELPGEKQSWNVYLSYYNHDLGPEFIRYIGANNPANGGVNYLTLNGRGNSFPEAGTGQIFLAQFGYLKKLKNHGIQPNLLIELADFEALTDYMLLWEGGVNYLLDGHKSKLSFMYQSRPLFAEAENGPEELDRKGSMVLQYQISF